MDFRKYLPSLVISALVAKVVLAILVIFFVKTWNSIPLNSSSMVQIEGEIVVVEPKYAHIKLKDKVVRVEYKCICSDGWKEKQLANSKYLKATTSLDGKDYKAWVLFLDKDLVFDDLTNSATRYYLWYLGAFISLLCIAIIFFEKRHEKIDESKWQLLGKELDRIADNNVTIEDRLKDIDNLTSRLDAELIEPFANLAMLNTLPDPILTALGNSMGRLIIHDDAFADESDFESFFNFVQPAAKKAVLATLAEIKARNNSESKINQMPVVN